MGAWGTGIFENDEAMDWLAGWDEAAEGEGDADEPGRLAFVIGALAVAVEHKGYLDADIGECALAAAETVAITNGKPSSTLALLKDPEDPIVQLKKWASTRHADILRQKEVRDLALQAIDRSLGKDSEVAELWADSEEDGATWLAGIKDLQARLRD